MTTAPMEIIIIRHGEKLGDPKIEHPDDGIDLSPKGMMRAASLAISIPDKFGEIDYIFATKSTKHSRRPVMTVRPLAKRLNLKINSNYGDDEYDALADRIFTKSKYDGTRVVICWHHGKIPELVRSLGGKTVDLGSGKFTEFPKSWPEEVFDRILVIKYFNQITTPIAMNPFKNHPQSLLFGDSDK